MARNAQTPALKRSRARKATEAPPDAIEAPAAASMPQPTEAPEPPQPAPPAGKLSLLAALLRREEGATLAEMGAATGWQAHSIRGAISGALKKKQGLQILSTKADGIRTYRIAS